MDLQNTTAFTSCKGTLQKSKTVAHIHIPSVIVFLARLLAKIVEIRL